MRINTRLLSMAFAAACLAAVPAMAQDADLRGLSEELQRLGNDIKDIQLYIFRSEGPAPSILETGAAQEEFMGATRAARLEVRFGEVEDQFRALTGQIATPLARLASVPTEPRITARNPTIVLINIVSRSDKRALQVKNLEVWSTTRTHSSSIGSDMSSGVMRSCAAWRTVSTNTLSPIIVKTAR